MESFTGIVQKGKKRGHELGYPTINILLSSDALSGIYCGRVTIQDEAPYQAAIFADQSRGILEAHILDFSDDLYGETVTIEIAQKIRDTQSYADDAALRAAIRDDIAKVREYFKN